jgi:hypothetical protein
VGDKVKIMLGRRRKKRRERYNNNEEKREVKEGRKVELVRCISASHLNLSEGHLCHIYQVKSDKFKGCSPKLHHRS